MSNAVGLSPSSFDQGIRARSAASAVGALVMAVAGLAGAWALDGRPAIRIPAPILPVPPVLGALLDPTPMQTAAKAALVPADLIGVPTAVSIASAGTVAPPAAPEPEIIADASARPPEAVPVPATVEQAELVPFPPPRPLDFQRPAAPTRLAMRTRMPRVATAPAVALADNRGFFEKLFGLNRPASETPALAYAPAETSVVGRSLGLASSMPIGGGGGGGGTAVYDIAAHTVTLPNGTRLEAHSGLGEHLDDPGSVHLRMRGATPPHTYDLSLREKLFHGVRALRLTPVGSGHIFGRDGLLAHTYMLGPNGQSNGCVSFRDYQAFLQAFERGDVKRLVVVGRS